MRVLQLVLISIALGATVRGSTRLVSSRSHSLARCVELVQRAPVSGTAVLGEFREALEHSRPNVRECNQLLLRLSDAGQLLTAVEAYRSMVQLGPEPTAVTFSTLISRAARANECVLAEALFAEMLELGCEPDTRVYNCVIQACAKAGDPKSALGYLAELRARKLQPSVVTYNSLLDAFARTSNVTSMLRTFREMKLARLAPDGRTFSIVINGCARAERVNAAFAVLGMMKRAGLAPNEITYSTVINACGRTGQLDRALDTLAEMEAAKIRPNVITFTALIDAHGKHGNPEAALWLFERMVTSGCQPNEVTLDVLFNALMRAGQLERAVRMLQAIGRGTLESAVGIAGVDSAVGSAGVDSAVGIAAVDSAVAIAAPLASAAGGPSAGASSAGAVSSASRLRPTGRMYTTLLRRCMDVQDLKVLEATLELMVADRVHPPDALRQELASFCGRTQQLSQAFERVRKLCTELSDAISREAAELASVNAGEDAASSSAAAASGGGGDGGGIATVSATAEDATASRFREPGPLAQGRAIARESAGGLGVGGEGGSRLAGGGVATTATRTRALVRAVKQAVELAAEMSRASATGARLLPSLFAAPSAMSALPGPAGSDTTTPGLDTQATAGTAGTVTPQAESGVRASTAEPIARGVQDELRLARAHALASASAARVALRALGDVAAVAAVAEHEGLEDAWAALASVAAAVEATRAALEALASEQGADGLVEGGTGALSGLSPAVLQGPVGWPKAAGTDDRASTVPPVPRAVTAQHTSAADASLPTAAAAAPASGWNELLAILSESLSAQTAAPSSSSANGSGNSQRAQHTSPRDESARPAPQQQHEMASPRQFEQHRPVRLPHPSSSSASAGTAGVAGSRSSGGGAHSAEKLRRVFDVFKQMTRAGCAPDVATFNVLLGACAAAGDVRRALETFGALKGAGLEPDVITYTSLIKAYGKAGLVDGAEAVFASMRVGAARQAVGKSGASSADAGAGSLFAASMQTQVPPNEFTFGELMRAQLCAGNHARVLQLHELATQEWPDRQLKPRTLNLALRARCAESNLRAALRLLRQIREQGAPIDQHARYALCGLCSARGKLALAARIDAGELRLKGVVV